MSLGPNSLRARTSSAAATSSMGAAAIFALVAILCLAVLAVLAVSTGHSSLVLSQRQAATVQETYRAEIAAQTFYAELSSGTADLAVCSDAATAAAEEAGGGITVTASTGGDGRVFAEFACAGGRVLKVTFAPGSAGTYTIDAWRMTAVVNEEQPYGTLYLG